MRLPHKVADLRSDLVMRLFLGTDVDFTGETGRASTSRPGSATVPSGRAGPAKSSVVARAAALLALELRAASRPAATPLDRLTQHDARSLFAPVDQDAHLFAGTIGDNVVFARPDASEAERGQASATRRSWPTGWPASRSGLDTPVGERGSISRAASASGSRWPGPSSRRARCSCSTSRAAASTRRWPTATARRRPGRRGVATVLCITHRAAEAALFGRVVAIDHGPGGRRAVVAGRRCGPRVSRPAGTAERCRRAGSAPPRPTRSWSASRSTGRVARPAASAAPSAHATAALIGDTWLTTTTSPAGSRAPAPSVAKSSSQAGRHPRRRPRPGSRRLGAERRIGPPALPDLGRDLAQRATLVLAVVDLDPTVVELDGQPEPERRGGRVAGPGERARDHPAPDRARPAGRPPGARPSRSAARRSARAAGRPRWRWTRRAGAGPAPRSAAGERGRAPGSGRTGRRSRPRRRGGGGSGPPRPADRVRWQPSQRLPTRRAAPIPPSRAPQVLVRRASPSGRRAACGSAGRVQLGQLRVDGRSTSATARLSRAASSDIGPARAAGHPSASSTGSCSSRTTSSSSSSWPSRAASWAISASMAGQVATGGAPGAVEAVLERRAPGAAPPPTAPRGGLSRVASSPRCAVSSAARRRIADARSPSAVELAPLGQGGLAVLVLGDRGVEVLDGQQRPPTGRRAGTGGRRSPLAAGPRPGHVRARRAAARRRPPAPRPSPTTGRRGSPPPRAPDRRRGPRGGSRGRGGCGRAPLPAWCTSRRRRSGPPARGAPPPGRSPRPPRGGPPRGATRRPPGGHRAAATCRVGGACAARSRGAHHHRRRGDVHRVGVLVPGPLEPLELGEETASSRRAPGRRPAGARRTSRTSSARSTTQHPYHTRGAARPGPRAR